MKELQGLELSGGGWRGKETFSTDDQTGDIRYIKHKEKIFKMDQHLARHFEAVK